MIKRTWICALLFASACATSDELGETEQAIGPTAGVGDLNNDSFVDGKDAADWLHAWGLQVYTYGLTDDVHNLGTDLQRRAWDWQVKTYADACLPHGKTPFPVENVPGLLSLANAYARMPTQYLRELGREHYGLSVFGELGRFHKRWTGTANGEAMNLIVYRSGSATVAKARFGDRDWETLEQITISGSTLKFFRRSANQWFTGLVDTTSDGISNGTIFNGTFTDHGTSFVFRTVADYGGGATTMRTGFGDQPGCAPDTRTDANGGTWSLGTTPPGIALMIGAVANNYTVVHELGHAIRWLVEDNRVGFTAADANRLLATIPLAGDPDAACSGCSAADWDASLPGTGYVTHYAATNGQEDFAEMWANYIYDPQKLSNRIFADADLDPAHRLIAKRDFMQHVIDGQEPAPAAAIHPASHATYRFTAGPSIAYTAGALISGTLPGATRLSPSVAGDESSRLWVFDTGLDNVVQVRSIDSASHVSAARSLGIMTDLPVAPAYVAPGVMAVFAVEPGKISYRLIDSAGAVTVTGTVASVQPPRAMAAATLNGLIYLFALDNHGIISVGRMSYSGGILHLGAWTPLGNEPTSSIAAARVGNAIELVELAPSTRVRHARMDATGAWSAWAPDTVQATATAIGLDGGGTVYIKGFDGKIYAHPLGTSTPYALQPGL